MKKQILKIKDWKKKKDKPGRDELIKKHGMGYIDFDWVQARISQGAFSLSDFTYAEIQTTPLLYKLYITELKRREEYGKADK